MGAARYKMLNVILTCIAYFLQKEDDDTGEERQRREEGAKKKQQSDVNSLRNLMLYDHA
jgi:hypothetical protein